MEQLHQTHHEFPSKSNEDCSCLSTNTLFSYLKTNWQQNTLPSSLNGVAESKESHSDHSISLEVLDSDSTLHEVNTVIEPLDSPSSDLMPVIAEKIKLISEQKMSSNLLYDFVPVSLDFTTEILPLLGKNKILSSPNNIASLFESIDELNVSNEDSQNLFSEAISRPSSLVGWQIMTEKFGICLVNGFRKARGFATQYSLLSPSTISVLEALFQSFVTPRLLPAYPRHSSTPQLSSPSKTRSNWMISMASAISSPFFNVFPSSLFTSSFLLHPTQQRPLSFNLLQSKVDEKFKEIDSQLIKEKEIELLLVEHLKLTQGLMDVNLQIGDNLPSSSPPSPPPSLLPQMKSNESKTEELSAEAPPKEEGNENLTLPPPPPTQISTPQNEIKLKICLSPSEILTNKSLGLPLEIDPSSPSSSSSSPTTPLPPNDYSLPFELLKKYQVTNLQGMRCFPLNYCHDFINCPTIQSYKSLNESIFSSTFLTSSEIICSDVRSTLLPFGSSFYLLPHSPLPLSNLLSNVSHGSISHLETPAEWEKTTAMNYLKEYSIDFSPKHPPQFLIDLNKPLPSSYRGIGRFGLILYITQKTEQQKQEEEQQQQQQQQQQPRNKGTEADDNVSSGSTEDKKQEMEITKKSNPESIPSDQSSQTENSTSPSNSSIGFLDQYEVHLCVGEIFQPTLPPTFYLSPILETALPPLPATSSIESQEQKAIAPDQPTTITPSSGMQEGKKEETKKHVDFVDILSQSQPKDLPNPVSSGIGTPAPSPSSSSSSSDLHLHHAIPPFHPEVLMTVPPSPQSRPSSGSIESDLKEKGPSSTTNTQHDTMTPKKEKTSSLTPSESSGIRKVFFPKEISYDPATTSISTTTTEAPVSLVPSSSSASSSSPEPNLISLQESQEMLSEPATHHPTSPSDSSLSPQPSPINAFLKGIFSKSKSSTSSSLSSSSSHSTSSVTERPSESKKPSHTSAVNSVFFPPTPSSLSLLSSSLAPTTSTSQPSSHPPSPSSVSHLLHPHHHISSYPPYHPPLLSTSSHSISSHFSTHQPTKTEEEEVKYDFLAASSYLLTHLPPALTLGPSTPSAPSSTHTLNDSLPVWTALKRGEKKSGLSFIFLRKIF